MRHATIILGALFFILAGAAADAKPRHGLYRQSPIICDERGCSDRGGPVRAASMSAMALDANGNSERVISRRPNGCPHAFCGCEASLYVFGHIRPELNLASNWARKFPRAVPAPGMAAVRSHHVVVLMSHVEGSNWLVHDGNSGGGGTREHVISISGYIIVNPRGT
ncbi:MAG TPA: hypothetical protein VKG24_32275 [Pseudolabrys sp.]|jgi:hypothetical protein|nr:hypothetical protein [Pseudolabrys sp.]